jgi:NAD(P)H-flavin reductase/ferredoxin
MVLTMLLHLLRHFAFDRFHGFRWFSWISGVALVWLVYLCGINGYMLPWDHLAQYVIVTTFEWLDWLPTFGGTLMRNFIHRESVGDRFFSLLSFIHIGLPLVVLLLMWVHVQRVPKARTTPPRSVVASLLITLFLLSLARPVQSQGGAADLGIAVAGVRLDWFYLALFPLLTVWPLGQVWALVAAGTALLSALPWWPPKLHRGRYSERHVIVHDAAGAQTQLTLREGETLLEGGLREGLALPFDCRNGGCGVCLCSVERGAVEHRPYQRSALPDELKAAGKALMCCAVPLGDLVIEVEGLPRNGLSSPRRHVGRVVGMQALAEDVMRVLVAPADGETLRFCAGQYIQILLDDGQRRAFSFANPPHEDGPIELHVRRIPGGRFTGHVFGGMRVGDTLRFEGPFGDFSLRESAQPILFVAGATGFAPIKSIVEDAFHRGVQRPMRLYWGVRRPRDLYLLELAERWQREHANFRVIPVVSHAQAEDAWTGRTGLVHEAILADFPALAEYQVYVCGSLQMVEASVPAFVAQGLSQGACFSDAFLPAGSVPSPASSPARASSTRS